jgi:hypothetical protein
MLFVLLKAAGEDEQFGTARERQSDSCVRRPTFEPYVFSTITKQRNDLNTWSL